MKALLLLVIVLVIPYGFWRIASKSEREQFWAFTGRHFWFAAALTLVSLLAVLISTAGTSVRLL